MFEVTRIKIVPFGGSYNELEIVSEINHTQEDNCTPPHLETGREIYKSSGRRRGRGLG